jgi:2-dehydro-3-deoxyphosphogluconate aldolase/(4S)-4-hydroxy-2-oxoglutarate aldolase
MFNELRRFGLLPLVKIDNEEDALSVAKALSEGGLPAMEISFRSFAHSKALRLISKELPAFYAGVGNILNKDQLLRALDSHAKFAFSPGVCPATVAEACKRSVIYAPGVCTPTDMLMALNAGASSFQFFPAAQAGGITMLKALIEPVQHLGVEFFVKGGITPEMAEGYLKVPQVAASSAPWVAAPELIAAKDWAKITENAKAAVLLVRRLRAL